MVLRSGGFCFYLDSNSGRLRCKSRYKVCNRLMFRWPFSELPMSAVSYLLRTAANLCYRVLGTTVQRNWQFAEIRERVSAVRGTTVPELPQWRKNLIFTMVYCRNVYMLGSNPCCKSGSWFGRPILSVMTLSQSPSRDTVPLNPKP
jgi:hypothetical protein